jgi:predicted RNA-binding protein YlxR (DUF448 family)
MKYCYVTDFMACLSCKAKDEANKYLRLIKEETLLWIHNDTKSAGRQCTVKLA